MGLISWIKKMLPLWIHNTRMVRHVKKSYSSPGEYTVRCMCKPSAKVLVLKHASQPKGCQAASCCRMWVQEVGRIYYNLDSKLHSPQPIGNLDERRWRDVCAHVSQQHLWSEILFVWDMEYNCVFSTRVDPNYALEKIPIFLIVHV